MEKLNNALAKIGIKPEELQGRASRKYAEYKRIFNSKLKTIKNEDGTFKPHSKQKLQDLGEDILELAVIQMDLKEEPPKSTEPQPKPEPPEPQHVPGKKKDSGFFGFNIFK
jgi:hypothetical protein